MTDWSRERWRKLYVREPLKQQAWPVLARGLRDYLIRRAEDDGELAASKEDLLEAIGAKSWERQFIADAIDLLVSDGFLVADKDGIRVRNLPAAQANERTPPRAPRPPREPNAVPSGRWAGTTAEERSEAARRAAIARHGKRDASTHAVDASSDASGDASSSHPVTHVDASGCRIGDASSPRAVSGQDLPLEGSESQRDQREERDQTRARATHVDASTHVASTHPSDASSSSLDFTDSDAETVIPLDLIERAERLGVFSSMLRRMQGVHIEQLRAKARDFVDYWAIGGGTGQRRRRWMSRLREDIRKAHEQNKLKPIGALEHEAVEGEGPGLSEEQRARLAKVREELDRTLAAKGQVALG